MKLPNQENGDRARVADRPAAGDLRGLRLAGSSHRQGVPQKPALPHGLAISRRIRFPVPATGTAALQARQVARPALKLILGAGAQAERLSRRVETCLAELVAAAYTSTTGDDLLCSVWTDHEHVFLAVEHDLALPRVPSDVTIGLSIVKAIADDYGTHSTDTGHQSWAAIVRD